MAPKKIFEAQFKLKIYRVSYSIASWSHVNISLAGKVILINSSLQSIPLLPFLLLYLRHCRKSISKLMRNFHWAKGGNHSDIRLMGWNTAILKKFEGQV